MSSLRVEWEIPLRGLDPQKLFAELNGLIARGTPNLLAVQRALYVCYARLRTLLAAPFNFLLQAANNLLVGTLIDVIEDEFWYRQLGYFCVPRDPPPLCIDPETAVVSLGNTL